MPIINVIALCLSLGTQAVCDGVTYAEDPSSLWVPVSALRQDTALKFEIKKSTLLAGDLKVPLRKLYGTDDWVAKVTDLRKIGFGFEWDDDEKKAGLFYGDDVLVVNLRPKRVAISLDDQEMRAFQGRLLVLRSRVSTGFNDRTPEGLFAVLGKERLHYSSLFGRVPMPFSVHVTGNIFIHAFQDVPPFPASHGCIRLPPEAARSFFDWVELGVLVEIR